MQATRKIDAFFVTGIFVRTSNENGAAARDIPALWNRFMTEDILAQIPGKTSSDLYCLYTEYEKDHTRPYTTVLGCSVAADAPVPDGFKKISIAAGSYAVFNATGNLTEGPVYAEWLKIWQMDLNRRFATDFEVYGPGAQDPTNGEVNIFVGIH